jgi:hypothetical protein
MRKLSVIIICLIFTAISCDQAATHEFYVQNHCEESITVEICCSNKGVMDLAE